MGEEPLDLERAQLAGIAAAMKGDITLQPLQVSLLGPQRQVASSHALAGDREDPWERFDVSI